MQRRRSPLPVTHSLLGLAVLAAIGCGGDSGGTGGPDSATVAYSITASPDLGLDSVKYDNGSGTLVKENSPGNGWIKSQSFRLPGSVEGILFIHATSPGSVTFRVLWTIDGATSGDSATVQLNGAGFTTLPLPHHSL